MKLKPIVVAMPIMFTLLTGCKSWDQSNYNNSWPFGHHSMSMHARPNGHILQDFISLNEAEISVAKVAERRAHCQAIRHFAHMMVHDHSDNLRRLHHVSHETGIAPVMNPEADKIREKGHHEVAKLKAIASKDFDKTFVDDMVRCHQHALHRLDKAIMDATDPKVIAYLKETHRAVSMHLQKAEELRHKCGL